MGVSGGGGEPLVALVVDVEAVDEILFIPLGVGATRLAPPPGLPLDDVAPGGG